MTWNWMITNIRWEDDESELVTINAEPIEETTFRSTHTVNLFAPDLSPGIPITTSWNKGEIQRELLVL